MTLRGKMLAGFGFVFVLVFAAVCYLSQALILRGAGRLEREQMIAALGRVDAALRSGIDDVDGHVRDWAWRASPPGFLADGRPDDAGAALPDSAWQAMRINVAAFVDPDGAVVRGVFYDSERKVAGPLPESFRALLAGESPLRRLATRDDGVHGLMMTETGPFLVAARAVIPRPGDASRGVLVMGRRLGESERIVLGTLTGISIRFEPAFPNARLALLEA